MLDNLIDSFVAGIRIARDCVRVLAANLSLLVLPLFSITACILLVAGFLWPSFPSESGLREGIEKLSGLLDGTFERGDWKVASLTLLYYVLLNFVMCFFNAALVHCCLFRLRGIPVSLLGGLLAAVRRTPELLAWSLLSSTVGLLLRMLESSTQKSGQYGRHLIVQLLGFAWGLATFFIIPVLVIERVGPFRAVRRSAKVLSETWGDGLGGHVGVGLVMLPLWLAGFGLLWFSLKSGAMLPGHSHLLFVIAILSLILIGLIQSTLETILMSALYLFATQSEIPAQWEAATVEQAFYRRGETDA